MYRIEIIYTLNRGVLDHRLYHFFGQTATDPGCNKEPESKTLLFLINGIPRLKPSVELKSILKAQSAAVTDFKT